MVNLVGRDILDGAQFTREELERIMEVAADFRGIHAKVANGIVSVRLGFFDNSQQGFAPRAIEQCLEATDFAAKNIPQFGQEGF